MQNSVINYCVAILAVFSLLVSSEENLPIILTLYALLIKVCAIGDDIRSVTSRIEDKKPKDSS